MFYKNLSAFLSDHHPQLLEDLENYLRLMNQSDAIDGEELSSRFLDNHHDLNYAIKGFSIWRETIGIIVRIF